MDNRNRTIRAFVGAAAVAAALLLAGCPNPITQATVNQMKDKAAGRDHLRTHEQHCLHPDRDRAGHGAGQRPAAVAHLGGHGDPRRACHRRGCRRLHRRGWLVLVHFWHNHTSTAPSPSRWPRRTGTTTWERRCSCSRPRAPPSPHSRRHPATSRCDLGWEGIPGASTTRSITPQTSTLPTESYGAQIVVACAPLHASTVRAEERGDARVPAAGADRRPKLLVGLREQVPLSPFTLAPVVTGGYREILL